MTGLAEQLGVEWRLLLTQGVNFFVLLAALTVLVYRPLLKLLEERRQKIELGLRGAEEIERRLREIEEEKAGVLGAAEREAVARMNAAETDAKARGADIVKTAQAKSESLLAEAAQTRERTRLAALAELEREAAGLVKSALVKTVGLDPDSVDEALVRKAVGSLKF